MSLNFPLCFCQFRIVFNNRLDFNIFQCVSISVFPSCLLLNEHSGKAQHRPKAQTEKRKRNFEAFSLLHLGGFIITYEDLRGLDHVGDCCPMMIAIASSPYTFLKGETPSQGGAEAENLQGPQLWQLW